MRVKYEQYCTSVSPSECRYFYMLVVTNKYFLFNIRDSSLEVRNFDVKQKKKKKMSWNICFVIYLKHQSKSGWMLTKRRIFQRRIFQWQHLFSTTFFSKKYSNETIILNFLVLIVVIIFFFFCEITEPLGIITKLLLNSDSET